MGFPRGWPPNKATVSPRPRRSRASQRRRAHDHHNNDSHRSGVHAASVDWSAESRFAIRRDIEFGIVHSNSKRQGATVGRHVYSICAASTSPLMSCSTTTNRCTAAEETTNAVRRRSQYWLNAEESAPRPEVVSYETGHTSCDERAQGLVLDSGVPGVLDPRITTRQISCSCTTRSEQFHLGGSAHSTRGTEYGFIIKGTLQSPWIRYLRAQRRRLICFDSSRPIVLQHGRRRR